MQAMSNTRSSRSATGFVSAVSAFLIWGLSPVFYKALRPVPPFEILMHRMVWSFLFLLPLLLLFGRWNTFLAAFRDRKTLRILFGTTFLVAGNWFLFIWAINNDHILQASLGYYTNPLVNVLLAMVFLGERLRRLQIVAVLVAFAGVVYMTPVRGSVSLGSAGTGILFRILRIVA
jgi:chloramphenicol-sensitive protein RarD